jgi:heme/copper-type cytochrome/quinol oxidase subunit 2
MTGSLLATLLLHGDDRMDLIYFWSSILIVTLPLVVFGVLTYLLVKQYRRREQAAGSREQ